MTEEVTSIPLRVKSVPRRERAPRAIREIKKSVKKRTEKKVKIDRDLNEKIWERGAQKPPSSVRVKLIEEEGQVIVQPAEKEAPEPMDEFECGECGKTFSTERGLKVHETHSHEEEEGFSCGECGKEFDTKRGLSIHESQKHEEEQKDPKDILGGTISEAKEEIEKIDSPDYERLLEVEEKNKDRKGMKAFLEGKLEE